MPKHRKKPRIYQRFGQHGPPPKPLKRAPQTDLATSVSDLDRRVLGAADAVAERLGAEVKESLSLSELQLLTTQSQLLLAMRGTHGSIRRLTEPDKENLDLSIDALPLTRVQLERCFLALLLADNPGRWHSRYRKNAWKAFAEKFFRDRQMLGDHPPYDQYFASDGPGIKTLRAFAREMDVSEDELQTLRTQILDEKEEDPRFKQWFIADMPTPGRSLKEIKNQPWKNLANVLYPFYDNLSHFSHGGLVGVMEAAILRSNSENMNVSDADKQRFWSAAVLETTLPNSYAAIVFVASLFARQFLKTDEALRSALRDAWTPYVADGIPLGVTLYDTWARNEFETDPGDTAE